MGVTNLQLGVPTSFDGKVRWAERSIELQADEGIVLPRADSKDTFVSQEVRVLTPQNHDRATGFGLAQLLGANAGSDPVVHWDKVTITTRTSQDAVGNPYQMAVIDLNNPENLTAFFGGEGSKALAAFRTAGADYV